MKYYLLLLFVVSIFSCKKEEEEIIKVDLLSTTLNSTQLGFTGTINNSYFYFTDSIMSSSYTNSFGSEYFYSDFYSGVAINSISVAFYIHLQYMITDSLNTTNDQFFNYIKLGQYNVLEKNDVIDVTQSSNNIVVRTNLASNNGYYFSDHGLNPSGENYFNIIDTLHTVYNGKIAVKYRAKIKCKLYSINTDDSTSIEDGVLVGLFVKP